LDRADTGLKTGFQHAIADRLSMMRVHADGINGGGKQTGMPWNYNKTSVVVPSVT